jgi:hypothetical protein
MLSSFLLRARCSIQVVGERREQEDSDDDGPKKSAIDRWCAHGLSVENTGERQNGESDQSPAMQSLIASA